MPKSPGFAARLGAALRRVLLPAQARGFAAAKLNRLTDSWRLTAEKIDDEIKNDLDALRARSRTLEFDNDFLRRYLDLVETNLIGESAPRLISLADNAPGQPDTGARSAIVKSWLEWGKPGRCEVSGSYSFTSLCQAIVRGTAPAAAPAGLRRAGGGPRRRRGRRSPTGRRAGWAGALPPRTRPCPGRSPPTPRPPPGR